MFGSNTTSTGTENSSILCILPVASSASKAAPRRDASDSSETLTGRPRTSARICSQFGEELSGRLRELARAEGVTLFMLLLAGFEALLWRYTGQERFAVGTPVANRTRAELEGLIGFFVNTLALRADLSGDPTFEDLLGRVRELTLGAYEHQEVPFERVVEELQPARSLSTPV